MVANGEGLGYGSEKMIVFLAARMWDVRPFAPTERCVKSFLGHQHNFEKVIFRLSHDFRPFMMRFHQKLDVKEGKRARGS